MTVAKSPPKTLNKGLNSNNMEPSTPAQIHEPSSTLQTFPNPNPITPGAMHRDRGSLRLLFKLNSADKSGNQSKKNWALEVKEGFKKPSERNLSSQDHVVANYAWKGKRKLDLDGGNSSTNYNKRRLLEGSNNNDKEGEKMLRDERKENLVVYLEADSSSDEENGSFKRKRKFSGEEKGKGKILVKDDLVSNCVKIIDVDSMVDVDSIVDLDSKSIYDGQRRREDKEGKGIIISDVGIEIWDKDSSDNRNGPVKDTRGFRLEEKGKEKFLDDALLFMDTRGFSGEEKGKEKFLDDALLLNVNRTVKPNLESQVNPTEEPNLESQGDYSVDNVSLGANNLVDNVELQDGNVDLGANNLADNVALQAGNVGAKDLADYVVLHDGNVGLRANNLADNVALQDGNMALGANNLASNVALQDGGQGNANTTVNESWRREQFRDIARQNAYKFAHFSSQEQENVTQSKDATIDNENLSGAFAIALKVVKDQAEKLNAQKGTSPSDKSQHTTKTKKSQDHRLSKKSVPPSLEELCLKILIKNADAIVSLENIPDTVRHKLSQLLCDSRRMTGHFFDLLVRGSPREVRLRDSSWITEEQFTESFMRCDTKNLTVLQLDQCGRCMADYVLHDTLARSSSCMPALTILSLSGACRLTDVGLSAIVSSAPALRSINLSQCSLLTSSSINTLADSLGSVLKELYINDCESVEGMLMLPGLKKLKHLEVLSLARIQTVCDDFVRKFINARGHNLKELVLNDCVKLTDSSMKVIGENCPGLCALELINLSKLTDSSIGFLANGCPAIQTLKLCRNLFSDEAIAAFLETSGECLMELSLNNVTKVGRNTALSLARRSRKLLSLDLSWCRQLTNEDVGLIVDSCLSLKVLKVFGCTQITREFLDGHWNAEGKIAGLKLTPILENLKLPDPHARLLRYSS